jgi:hypothetical protein
MKILNTVRNNIYNSSYFEEVKSKSLGASFKYFVILALTASLIYTIISSFVFIPQITGFIRERVTSIATSFPSSLVVTIKGGAISINKPEPYKILLPAGFQSSTTDMTGVKNLLVIDTKTAFVPSQLDKYKTLILIKSNFVVSKNSNGYNLSDFSKMPDTQIDKAFVDNFFSRFSGLMKYLVPLAVPIVFIGFSLFHLKFLFFCLIAAFFIWLVI